MSQLWSWALSVWGIAGLILAGRHKSIGWAVGLSAQVLWIAYAISTSQWGFIVSALAYSVVYGWNWRSWSRKENEESKRDGI